MPTLTDMYRGNSKTELEANALRKGYEFFGHSMLTVDQDYSVGSASAHGCKFQASITIREMPERKMPERVTPIPGQRFRVTVEGNHGGIWEEVFVNTNSGETVTAALVIANGFWQDRLRGIN